MIGLLSDLLPSRPRNANLENPAMTLTDPRAWEDMLSGPKSSAGVPVSHRGALKYAPVFQAVSIISGDMAVMTLNVFKRTGDEKKDREVDWQHSAQPICSEQWNDETPAFEGRRRLFVHALLWQNGYAFIDRQGRVGPAKAMYNLLPDRTCPHRDADGKMFYVTEVAGQLVPLLCEEVFHLKGLSVEPGLGFDLVAAARDSWGLALAAEGYGAKFFANGSQSGGVLEIPAHFTDKAKDNIEDGWRKRYTGPDNWFKTVILRDGAKFHNVTIDAQKSQMHQLREDQRLDTASYFNLPPSKLGIKDSVSYNSAEQSQLAYITGCLNHWRMAEAGEAKLKLLSPAERKSRSHYLEHNTTKLIETDTKTRNEVSEIQRRNEVINANEWRRRENLPPREDPGGEEYVNPNTKAKEAAPAAKTAEGGEESAGGKASAVADRARALLEDRFSQVHQSVKKKVVAKAANDKAFVSWVDSRSTEQGQILDACLGLTVKFVATVRGGDGDLIYDAVSARFFRELHAAMDCVLQTAKAAELPDAVGRAYDEFERAATPALTALVLGA